jgi:hypothetical protein
MNEIEKTVVGVHQNSDSEINPNDARRSALLKIAKFSSYATPVLLASFSDNAKSQFNS